MNRAINLALRLEAESHGRLKVAANTSTVELVDDIEPQADNVEADTQVRNNSAIHLKVYVAEWYDSMRWFTQYILEDLNNLSKDVL